MWPFKKKPTEIICKPTRYWLTIHVVGTPEPVKKYVDGDDGLKTFEKLLDWFGDGETDTLRLGDNVLARAHIAAMFMVYDYHRTPTTNSRQTD